MVNIFTSATSARFWDEHDSSMRRTLTIWVQHAIRRARLDFVVGLWICSRLIALVGPSNLLRQRMTLVLILRHSTFLVLLLYNTSLFLAKFSSAGQGKLITKFILLKGYVAICACVCLRAWVHVGVCDRKSHTEILVKWTSLKLSLWTSIVITPPIFISIISYSFSYLYVTAAI
jgi:hypothetical protein